MLIVGEGKFTAETKVCGEKQFNRNLQNLRQVHAAIHAEDVSGSVASLVARQKYNRSGNIAADALRGAGYNSYFVFQAEHSSHLEKY